MIIMTAQNVFGRRNYISGRIYFVETTGYTSPIGIYYNDNFYTFVFVCSYYIMYVFFIIIYLPMFYNIYLIQVIRYVCIVHNLFANVQFITLPI